MKRATPPSQEQFQPLPILFLQYQQPFGYLSPVRESHGLWFYYVHARRNYEEEVQGVRIECEGERSLLYNYHQFLTSVCKMYGTTIERITNYWPEIDMQCTVLELPKLPNIEKYRFNSKMEIRSAIITPDTRPIIPPKIITPPSNTKH